MASALRAQCTRRSTCRPLAALRAGFTLIELLVVTAIIIVITAVVFSSQGSFSSSILLSSTAYDVALSMNNAQTYGIGTRAVGGAANAGYGLDFKKSAPTTYAFFADSYPLPGAVGACHPLPANGASAPDAYPGNCVYDAGDALVSTYRLGNGVSVANFCAYNGSWSCSTTGDTALSQLDIVFIRPNAAAFIAKNGVYSSVPPVTKACITFTSPRGSLRSISISTTGQINGAAASCP